MVMTYIIASSFMNDIHYYFFTYSVCRVQYILCVHVVYSLCTYACIICYVIHVHVHCKHNILRNSLETTGSYKQLEILIVQEAMRNVQNS